MDRNILRIILALWVALILACSTTAYYAGKADAATVQDCRFIGITNVYAAPGSAFDPFTENTYRDYRCHKQGMRIDKVVFNTVAEKRALVPYVRDVAQRTGKPIAICWNGTRGKMLALSWFWAENIHQLNKAERQRYGPWIKQVDGCRVFWGR